MYHVYADRYVLEECASEKVLLYYFVIEKMRLKVEPLQFHQGKTAFVEGVFCVGTITRIQDGPS